MAYTLKSTGLAANIQIVVAVDDDGLIKGWSTPGAVATYSAALSNLTPHANVTVSTDGNWAGVTDYFNVSGSTFTAYNVALTHTASTDPRLYLSAGTKASVFAAFHKRNTGSTGSTYQIITSTNSLNDAFMLNGGIGTAGFWGGGSVRAAFGSTLPTDNSTKYSVSGHYDRTGATSSVWYANYGNTISAADGTANPGANGQTRDLVEVGGDSGQGHIAAGIYCVAVFKDATFTTTEAQALHSDWFGTLFESGASAAIPKTAGLFGGPFKRLITS